MTSYHHIAMQQSPACIQELHTDDSVWFELPNLPEDRETAGGGCTKLFVAP